MFHSSERMSTKEKVLSVAAVAALAGLALTGCSQAGAEQKPSHSSSHTSKSTETQKPVETQKYTIAYAPNAKPSLKATLPLANGGEAPLSDTTLAPLPESLASDPQKLAEAWINDEVTYLNASTGVNQQNLIEWIAKNDPMNSAEGGANEPAFDDQYFTDVDGAIFNKEFTFPGATDNGSKPLIQPYLDALSGTHDEVIGTARKSMYVGSGTNIKASKTPVYQVSATNVKGVAAPDAANIEIENLNTDKQVAVEISYTMQSSGGMGDSTGPTTWAPGTTKTVEIDFADNNGKLYPVYEKDVQ